MDNLQFWLYVIVAVIYMVAQARKKKKPQPGSAPERPVPVGQKRQPQRTQAPAPKKGPSFEDLLREITEAKRQVERPRPTPTPRPAPKPAYVDYDDDIEEEGRKPLESPDFDYRKSDKIFDIYEEAKKQAFNRPSLEESLVESEPSTYSRFKEFDLAPQKRLGQDYLAMLKDPNGFKNALILSELLNRKHF